MAAGGEKKLRARKIEALAREKEALARKAKLQVRSIEAGQRFEPPWVRFPGPADTLPEAERTAYFQDVFAPFWYPLTVEARQVYLLRNPPPAGEWQDMMADLLNVEVMDFPSKWQRRLLKRFVKDLPE